MSETRDISVIPPGTVAVRDGDGTVDLLIGLPSAIQATVHLTEAEAIDLCTDLIRIAMAIGAARKLAPSTTTPGGLVPV